MKLAERYVSGIAELTARERELVLNAYESGQTTQKETDAKICDDIVTHMMKEVGYDSRQLGVAENCADAIRAQSCEDERAT